MTRVRGDTLHDTVPNPTSRRIIEQAVDSHFLPKTKLRCALEGDVDTLYFTDVERSLAGRIFGGIVLPFGMNRIDVELTQ